MTSNGLKTALNYAKRGFAVLPLQGVTDGICHCNKGKDCSRPGKHPLTKHGVRDATTDTKIIKRWWKRNPAPNIGVATGKLSGLLVLDIDPRNDGSNTLEVCKAELGNLACTRF